MVNQSPHKKWLIINSFLLDDANKTQIGREYNVSPRTVGRVISEYETQVEQCPVLLDIFNDYGQMVVEDTPFCHCDDDVQDFILDRCGDAGHLEVSDNLTVGDLLYPSEETPPKANDDLFPIHDEEEDDPSLDEENEEDCIELDDDDEEDAEYSLVATPKSITVTKKTSTSADSHTLSSDSDAFGSAWEKIRGCDASDEQEFHDLCAELYLLAQPREVLKKFSHGNLEIDADANTIKYDGYEVHNTVVRRIIDGVLRNGEDSVVSHLNFLDKLLDNPSYRAANSLYDFLEHNDIAITEDGDFIAFKVVTHDYKDCRTGEFDNSIGATPSMPRWMVEEDPNKTCAQGLHVCARHYISSFRSRGDRIVLCKVNPKNVVAIPNDYNNSKMRLCEYEVVGEEI